MTTGGCRCGEVQYAFTGDFVGSVFCYCTECQRRTGSDKFFGVWVPSENFRITRGTPTTYTRSSDTDNLYQHCFCPRCGTNLYAIAPHVGIHVLYVTSLDVSTDITPSMAIFTSSAPSWATFPDDVPQFDRMPPETQIPDQLR